MKRLIIKYSIFLLFFNIVNIEKLCSQGLLINTPLEERINSSSCIVEGEVIAQSSFWNISHTLIFTANTIKVIKQIKGENITDSIFVLTRGGIVGLNKQVDYPSLQLHLGDIGLFLINNSTTKLTNNKNHIKSYYPSYSKMSFIEYNKNGSARDDFTTYQSINRDIYSRLKHLGYDIGEKIKFEHKANQFRSPDAVSITSFSPSTITAGTQSVLTINGTDFGSTQGNGKVEFANADDGGSSYMEPISDEYISWSNTQIKVEVPSGAGTGSIKVTNDSNSYDESSSNLDITYNVSNIQYNSKMYRTNLVDADNSGGIEFVFNPDFNNNTNAKNAFIRALDSWRCSDSGGTGVYFADGGTSSENSASNDAVNIVTFSNSLPSGVLGRCTSYYSGCGGSSINWWVEELDVVFDDNPGNSAYSWNFDEADNSTSSSEYDFESVAVHELGHGHQLGHVIDATQIMNYNIANGQEKRYLSTNDVDGGNDVINFSSGVCEKSNMNIYSCSTVPLQIIAFEAKESTDGIALNWKLKTISELDEIVIQKSKTGDDFTEIAHIKNTIESNKESDGIFLDKTISVNNYYRLKLLDTDGSFSYSKIIYIFNGNISNSIKIYPNPTNGIINILNNSDETMKIYLMYPNGKIISDIIDISNKSNYLLDISKLPIGIYFLNIITNNTSSIKKIIKSN